MSLVSLNVENDLLQAAYAAGLTVEDFLSQATGVGQAYLNEITEEIEAELGGVNGSQAQVNELQAAIDQQIARDVSQGLTPAGASDPSQALQDALAGALAQAGITPPPVAPGGGGDGGDGGGGGGGDGGPTATTGSLSGAISNALDEVGTAISSIGTDIADAFSGAGQAISDDFDALVEGLNDALDNAVQDIEADFPAWTDIANNISEIVSDEADSLWGWIQDNILTPVQTFTVNKGQAVATLLFGQPTLSGIQTAQAPLPQISLTMSEDDARAAAQTILGDLYAPKGVAGYLVGKLLAFPYWISVIKAALSGVEREIEIGAAAGSVAEPLGVGDAVQAYRTGYWDITTLNTEASLSGISPERVSAYLAASYKWPSPGDLTSWVSRGIIDGNAFNNYMQAGGVDASLYEFYTQAGTRPVDPATSMSAAGRQTVTLGGFLPITLASQPPGSITALYQQNSLDPSQAAVDWMLHWNIPGMDWWVNAFFRGKVSQADVNNAAVAANFPAEVIQNLVDTQRPLLPMRVTSTLLSRGIITEAQAQANYTALGYDNATIAQLIAYAAYTKPTTTGSAMADLAKVTIATATGLFDDGAITADQLNTILLAHGYTADAAALQTEFITLKNDASIRKANAQALVDQVNLGQVTIADAVSQLHAAGYSQNEVLKYQKAMHLAKQTSLKLPTFAQAASMYKQGLIDEPTFTAFLVTLNYDPEWIPLLVQLEAPANADSTATP